MPELAATAKHAPRIVFATTNPGKLAEARLLLAELRLPIVSATELGLHVQVDENAPDYFGNAWKKAAHAARLAALDALAEDSGLEVAALGGAPGVRSARYGGPGLDDAGRNRALLKALEGTLPARRRARFICVLVLASPEGEVRASVAGACAGRIVEEPRGDGGFGYDPVFEVEGTGLTFAEMSAAEKASFSHRARAFRELARVLHAPAGGPEPPDRGPSRRSDEHL